MDKHLLTDLLRRIHESPEVEMHSRFSGNDHFALSVLAAVGYIEIDDVTDYIVLTTAGRLWAGLRGESEADFTVERLAEHTGNVAESELAALYVESKMRAADMHATADATNRGCYETVGRVLHEIAHEFRSGLHLPQVHIEGRVIPYNEDRSTGIVHADALRTFFQDVYARNLKAGWWTDITTGEPKKRSVGELFMLFVTEIAEAYEAYEAGDPDDKLPHHPGLGVELADLGIRWADFCGALLAGNIVVYSGVGNPGESMFREVCDIARRYEAIRKTPQAVGEPEEGDFEPAADVALMVDEKLAFNAKREDHKIENRLKADGKRT
jgi:hypothetical protein